MSEGPSVVRISRRGRKPRHAIPVAPDTTFEEYRAADPAYAKLSRQRDLLDEHLKALWIEYRRKADQLQRKIAYVDREMRAEETYVRGRFDLARAKLNSQRPDSGHTTIPPPDNANATTH